MSPSQISASETAGVRPHGSITEVAGLDTMRFLAAMVVVFSHGAVFPLAAYVPKKAGIWAALVGLNNCAFNGAAAVMIFFVISGFCIHYKYACGVKFALLPFLSRRLLRIAIPVVCALALANALGRLGRWALDAVLWSLYYEIIYYAIYPALRIPFSRVGIAVVIPFFVAISLVLIGLDWDTVFYWQYPVSYGWLVPLPAWLFGCLLAEKVAGQGFWRPPQKIWGWRISGLAYAGFAMAYFFHGPTKIGMPALLLPFIVYSFFWLGQEMRQARTAGTISVLEWAGRWSYSIYLIHGMILESILPPLAIDPALFWAVRLIAVLVGSYCFYLLVEWPAHRFARTVSYRLSLTRRNLPVGERAES